MLILLEVRVIGRCVYINGAIDSINEAHVKDKRYQPGRDICVADCLSRSYDDVKHPTMLPGFDVDEEQQLVGTILGLWDTAIVTPSAVAAATKLISRCLAYVSKTVVD
jgi:hypothetical protein